MTTEQKIEALPKESGLYLAGWKHLRRKITPDPEPTDLTTDDLKSLTARLKAMREALEERTRRVESLTIRNSADWDGDGIAHLEDFMCVCHADGKKACDELMGRAADELGSDQMLDSLVYGMAGGDYHASIDYIASDQWAMIGASVMKRNGETGKYQPLATIAVECDVVEHGLARVWELVKQAKSDDIAREALASEEGK